MSWPPTIGQRVPLAERAFGVREKLAAYCLNLDHEVGAPKAQGFRRILGIGRADVDHLAEALRAGVREATITDVRDNAPFGVLCEVRVRVVGLREHQLRVVTVTTAWELRRPDVPPRLVTAYIDG